MMITLEKPEIEKAIQDYLKSYYSIHEKIEIIDQNEGTLQICLIPEKSEKENGLDRN